jgi:hypothetical protein
MDMKHRRWLVIDPLQDLPKCTGPEHCGRTIVRYVILIGYRLIARGVYPEAVAPQSADAAGDEPHPLASKGVRPIKVRVHCLQQAVCDPEAELHSRASR